tara:strand:+ start:1752 stop:1946 length:195 start_codon:yes stop_codon:yes gene_type:complete
MLDCLSAVEFLYFVSLLGDIAQPLSGDLHYWVIDAENGSVLWKLFPIEDLNDVYCVVSSVGLVL